MTLTTSEIGQGAELAELAEIVRFLPAMIDCQRAELDRLSTLRGVDRRTAKNVDHRAHSTLAACSAMRRRVMAFAHSPAGQGPAVRQATLAELDRLSTCEHLAAETVGRVWSLADPAMGVAR